MKIKLGANLIFVKNLTQSKEWYQKVLLMKTVDFRPPEFLEMRLGKNVFYIETYNPKRAKGFKEVKIGGRSSVIFEVENIFKFIEECRQKNVKVIVDPVKQFWGGWNAVISDPDGNEFVIDEDK